MPITPYHFGPSGLIGLVFKRRIDLPVFLLANVVVDLEVLVISLSGLGHPTHRYCHTLLGGAIVGALWGLGAYPLRGLWRAIMSALSLPYDTTVGKMVLSGVLGVWAHVLIDSLQHDDMRIFWPVSRFCVADHVPYVVHRHIPLICLMLLLCLIPVYGRIVAHHGRRTSADSVR
jgi:membrane-bound metal-dependent hydrolase YbcI (DUF457 family)